MGRQWQEQYPESYGKSYGQSGQWQQWKGKGKQTAPWRGKGKDGTSKKGEKPVGAFPKYDVAEPKQMVVVSEQKEESASIVRVMQKAVSNTKKAEQKTRRIQEELACWLSYQQELRTACKTEHQRFLQDSARLKEELAEAMAQERQAKTQLQPTVEDQFDALMLGQAQDIDMTPPKHVAREKCALDLDTVSEEDLRRALQLKTGRFNVDGAESGGKVPESPAVRHT